MNHYISPSILAADFLNLGKDIEMLNQSEADWIHCDIMDGSFVPNLSFGLPVIEQISNIAKKPLDVHLMIVQPERYISSFKKAGADLLTIHFEASTHLHRTIMQIKEEGMKAGVSLNPHTPVSVLEEILPELDLVLLMSVNPGYGGQKFIKSTIEKTKKLKELIRSHQTKTLIEIDGGVNFETGKELLNAGADVLVAGNFVFHSNNPITTIKELKAL